MESPTLTPKSELHLGQISDALLRLRDGDFTVRLPGDLTNYAGMVARVFNSLAQLMEEFSSEVIRVTDEVGTKGMLGCQAEVFGIYGKWREMHDSLNRMAVGLTVELRRTSQFAQAASQGQKLPELKNGEFIAGEVAEMQRHISAMADNLAVRPELSQ